MVQASIFNNVKKVVALSTDKASSPINLYGATKLCSDKLFLSSNNIIGKKNITFSIHVHIGLDDKDKLVKVTNTLRRWIAPMLALSTNSPFFEGENTGML